MKSERQPRLLLIYATANALALLSNASCARHELTADYILQNVKPGMSPEQVTRLVGQPERRQLSDTVLGREVWGYKVEQEHMVMIMFQGMRVEKVIDY